VNPALRLDHLARPAHDIVAGVVGRRLTGVEKRTDGLFGFLGHARLLHYGYHVVVGNFAPMSTVPLRLNSP